LIGCRLSTVGIITTDGDGLILRVKPNGASWTLRYTSPSGRRREFGLGRVVRDSLEAAGASLKRARQRAEKARALLESGLTFRRRSGTSPSTGSTRPSCLTQSPRSLSVLSQDMNLG
jgi:Arm DNA-binding domain